MRGISPQTNEINHALSRYLIKIELEKTFDFLIITQIGQSVIFNGDHTNRTCLYP